MQVLYLGGDSRKPNETEESAMEMKEIQNGSINELSTVGDQGSVLQDPLGMHTECALGLSH